MSGSGSASASGAATPSSQHGATQNRPETPSCATSQLRNEIGSPTTTGSEDGYDSQSVSFADTFAPGILSSRLGRSLAGAGAGSSLSLTESGSSSPSLALTGFNAISTVLNNPSKRQHPIDPKSSRFPPLTPTPHVLSEIPKAKKADLEGYLSSVRPEWDRFMRNQRLGRQGKATVGQGRDEEGDDGELQITAAATTTDNDGDDSTAVNGSPAKRRGHRARGSVASLSADLRSQPALTPKKRLPSLSAIPQVFFSEDFDLGNPYTFDLVTERYKATTGSDDGPSAPSYDVALNQMLQEKLSYYSDVVEQHLVIEIGQQSSSFFAALGNLKDLNAEAESCIRRIDHLKSELVHIDEDQAKVGLRVVQEQDRRRQLYRKRRAIESVQEVVERRDLVRLLVQQGETEEALEVIDGLRSVLSATDAAGEGNSKVDGPGPGPGLRFAELQSLSFILPQLQELESSLSGTLQRDLVSILAEDLAERVRQTSDAGANGSTQDSYFSEHHLLTAASIGNPLSPAATSTPRPPSVKPPSSPFGNAVKPLSQSDDQLRARITPLIGGLVRTNGIDGLATAYREAALQAVKKTWCTRLGDDDGDGNQWAELAAYLETEDPAKNDLVGAPEVVIRFRDAEHHAFLSLGRRLFEALLRCLKGIDSQAKLIVRILDELHASSSGSGNSGGAQVEEETDGASSGHIEAAPTMPDGVPTTLPTTMADVVTASTELSHVLTARLISVRSSTHTAMDLAPFLAIFQLCWSYVLSSELVSRKMIVGLRGSVLSQAKGFLSHFHRKRIEKAAKAVEEETWAQSDVGADVQRQVRLIVESAIEDPAAFVVTGEAAGRAALDAAAAGPAHENSETVGGSDRGKALEIEDRSYFVVSASLDVLKLLADYLRVIINLPLLTTEAMGRVVEFLKQFNSRTCQVVLGAGAMRSAGLKNITAKHLALASQSLSIMISLIPYIRETVRRHLSPKQAVMLTEFDKLRRDFQEHQYEIHAKLVAIMSDRLTVHCRALGNIEWNAPLPAGEEGDAAAAPLEANKYAADLAKETATLHKVLSKYLQPPVVEHVIGQVLRAIDVRVAAELEKIDVQTPAARRRMEEDVGLLEAKLSALKHVTWKGEALTAVLEQKQAPASSQPSANIKGGEAEAVASKPQQQQPQPQPVQQHAYKTRLPSLFTRRQQQQQSQQQPQQQSQQQQQQQSQQQQPLTAQQPQQQQPPQGAAVRFSADSNASSNTVQQAQSSYESTPRTSMQDIVVPPVPNKDVEGEQTASNDAADAVEVPPPTPPAKPFAAEQASDVSNSTATEPAQQVAAAEAVGADQDGAQAFTEPSTASTQGEEQQAAEELTKRPLNDGVNPGSEGATDQTHHDATAGPAAENSHYSESTATPAPGDNDKPAGSDADGAAELVPAPAAASVAASQETPAKPDSGIASGFSSPVKSGASTPASTSNTPSKPGRMSLKERLAEAAKKRMMAQQAPAPAPTSASVAAEPARQPAPEALETKAEISNGQAVNESTPPRAGAPSLEQEAMEASHADSAAAAASATTVETEHKEQTTTDPAVLASDANHAEATAEAPQASSDVEGAQMVKETSSIVEASATAASGDAVVSSSSVGDGEEVLEEQAVEKSPTAVAGASASDVLPDDEAEMAGEKGAVTTEKVEAEAEPEVAAAPADLPSESGAVKEDALRPDVAAPLTDDLGDKVAEAEAEQVASKQDTATVEDDSNADVATPTAAEEAIDASSPMISGTATPEVKESVRGDGDENEKEGDKATAAAG